MKALPLPLNLIRWRNMMKNVMIVDDNCLTAEGIEKKIDWSALDATVIAVEYNSLSALDILKDTPVESDHLGY